LKRRRIEKRRRRKTIDEDVENRGRNSEADKSTIITMVMILESFFMEAREN